MNNKLKCNILVRAIYHVMLLDILKSIRNIVMVVNKILSAIIR